MIETYVTILVDLEQVVSYNSIYKPDEWGTKENPVNVDLFSRFLVGNPFYGETQDLRLPPNSRIKWQGVDVSTCTKLFDNQRGEKIVMKAVDARGKTIPTDEEGWNKLFDLAKCSNAQVKNGKLITKQAANEDYVWLVTQPKLVNCNIKYDIYFEFEFEGKSKYAIIDPGTGGRPFFP